MTRAQLFNSLRHRGFASIMAVALIGLIGVTLLAMSSLLSTSLRRTRQETADAQLRQMLLAGTTQVIEQSQSWGDAPAAGKTSLPLPDSLRALDATAEVQLLPQSTGRMEVQITARLGKRISHQTLHWSRSENRWVIVSAAIAP